MGLFLFMDTYYSQKGNDEIMGIDGIYTIAEEGSFLVAQSNLLLKFGYKAEPSKLNKFYQDKSTYARINGTVRDDLYWDSLLEYDHTISITKMDSGWPMTDMAIVKFQFQSIQKPFIDKNGEPVPNMIRHFCVMADYKQNLIIDSYDGVIKDAGPYGIPISYTVYGRKTKHQKKTPEKASDYNYTVLKDGESAWEIARKFKIPGIELIEHNDFEDPKHIPGGTQIRLPYRIPKVENKDITYELFDVPRKMHVSQDKGTRKFLFGNAKQPTDLLFTGPTVRQHTNLEIVAIAQVPIENDVYSYYMESVALGDYYNTGRVNQTVGYNHTHLSDGHIEKEEIPIQPIVTETLMQAAEEALQHLDEVEEVEELEVNYDLWKTTYKDFPEGHKHSLLKSNLTIHDLDDRHPPRLKERNYEVTTTGTFTGPDGVLYERPLRSATSYHWYGIPPALLEPESEVYNTNVELYEKVAARLPLTLAEKTFEVFARNLAGLQRFRGNTKK